MQDKRSVTGQAGAAALPAQPADHPLVIAARTLAATVLAPRAAQVDRSEVPEEHVRLLGDAGLLAPSAPASAGGGGAPPAVARAVTEVLAGACGSTWFVATQHNSPVRMLLGSDNVELQDRWLRPLASGSSLAGIAFAQLRRPGPPAVVGERVARGWEVTGHLPWLTSWGLAEVAMIGFRDGAGVVFALVPARTQPGFAAGDLLSLAAMQAARTVTVRLTSFGVADTDVALRLPYEDWAAADAAQLANVNPAVFGLLSSVLTRLLAEGERRSEPATTGLAQRLVAEAVDVRTQAYALFDDVPAGERVADRLALRASALELLTVASTALVAAGAGGSMSLDHPAQRWAREALFHLIQAQTAAVRAATMSALTAHRLP